MMREGLICAALVGFLVAWAPSGRALTLTPFHGDGAQTGAAARSNQGRFVVSAVLRRDGQSDVIKLVQSVERAESADAAVGAITRKALAQYPGYSVLSTLVSPLEEKPASCGFQATI